jgi:DNA polymerase III delta prime subunit
MSPNLISLINYLRDLTRYRVAAYFKKNIPPPVAPLITKDDTAFTRFLIQHGLTTDEFTILALALAPHIQPTIFDGIIAEFLPQGGDFAAFGGVKGTNQRSFQPTGETAVFLLAGNDLGRRIDVQKTFDPDHFFATDRIISLEELRPGEPVMSGRLILEPEFVELFTLDKIVRPRFGLNFPAERVETAMEWDDLVLAEQTMSQIQELNSWLNHGDTLLNEWEMGKRIKPGYRALFWGPPGTGKTLTSALLGKYSSRDVYRVDLSMVVSKFIGETEKNLASLFAKAENKDWILFFDEADALFGKRTSIRDAHDKYANQEVSYLLQRIEGYNGLVILATNFKSNIDDAFIRRFQSIVHFPLPNANERLTLWKKSLPFKHLKLDGINLENIAHRYELSGASINNIIQQCCLKALDSGDLHVSESTLREEIRKEFNKDGKIVN